MDKDTYLNFGALCIKLLNLRLLHGDILACNIHHRGFHPCSLLRLRHRITCLSSTLFHHHLPCFHHHHHHLVFNHNLACRPRHQSLPVHLRLNRPDHKSRQDINFVPLRSPQLRNGHLTWIIMTPPKWGALTCRWLFAVLALLIHGTSRAWILSRFLYGNFCIMVFTVLGYARWRTAVRSSWSPSTPLA